MPAIALLVSCSSGAERPTDRGPTPKSVATAGDAAAPGPIADSGRALTEVEARALLARRFRDAGFRVLHDVRVREGSSELTVDGYDPDRDVGFEYIAPSERGTDLLAAERSALSAGKRALLILDAASEQRVSAAADAFLASLADAGPR